MMKIVGSGSISQRHGSADPDPHQNVMDPQHWFLLVLQISDRTQYGTLLHIRSFQTTTLHIFFHAKFFNKFWMLRFGSNVGFLIKFFDAEDTKHCLQIVSYFVLILIRIRPDLSILRQYFGKLQQC
jgi:hypothetical protein